MKSKKTLYWTPEQYEAYIAEFKGINPELKSQTTHPVSKERNQPTRRGTILFQSKKEARYFDSLQLDPDVWFFLRQVPMELTGGVRYRADFLVFYKDGTYKFIDVKGRRTPMYILKKKQVEALYPIKIEEV